MKAKEIIIIILSIIGLILAIVITWPLRAYDNYTVSRMQMRYVKKMSDNL